MVNHALENRFTGRFRTHTSVSRESIQAADDAKSVADSFQTSRGILTAQEEAIRSIFEKVTEQVQAINAFQEQSGRRQVKNIPLPTESVKNSHGQRLGYIMLCAEFLSAGFLHFMEENLKLIDELEEKEHVIKSISAYNQDLVVLGSLETLTLDDLETNSPIISSRTEQEPIDEDDKISLPDPVSRVSNTKKTMRKVK